MPAINSSGDMASYLNMITERLDRLERSPQLGLSAITDPGAMAITDSSGRTLILIGRQPDGTLGLALYDPATGVKQVQMGQQAAGSGLYGLTIIAAGTSFLGGTTSASVVGAQTTSSTSYVTFGDDPVVPATIGPSGKAVVTFGATIGTGGDNDQGTVALTVDGVIVAGATASVSSAGVGIGVQASASQTLVVSGLAAGTRSFSLTTKCLTGAHGITARSRFVTVSPL